MHRKKVSSSLSETGHKLLAAYAEYRGMSLSAAIEELLNPALEYTYRQAQASNPVQRVIFDRHLGITAPTLTQNSSSLGKASNYLIR